MNNRGISAVVATVLIILITVAAISIIWVSVLPIIQENLDSVSSTNVDLTILNEGYTAFDNDTRLASIQIKRGDDEEDLKKIKLIFYISGDSEYLVFDDIPASNSASVYLFNFSRLEWGTPQEVAIIPIININGRLVEGNILHKTKLEIKSLRLSDADLNKLDEKGSASPDGSSGSGDEKEEEDEGGDEEPGCSDECSLEGETQCDGNLARECGNFDGDDCLEWQEVDCEDEGGICEDGMCVDPYLISSCGFLIDEPGEYQLEKDLYLGEDDIAGGEHACIAVGSDVEGEVGIDCNSNVINLIETDPDPYGIYVYTEGYNLSVDISDCEFSLDSYGEVRSSGVYFSMGTNNSVVEGCGFTGISQPIFSFNSKNLLIEDNEISFSGNSEYKEGISLSDVEGARLIDNHISGDFQNGIYFGGELEDVEVNYVCLNEEDPEVSYAAFNCGNYNSGEINGNIEGNYFSSVNTCDDGRPVEDEDYTSC